MNLNRIIKDIRGNETKMSFPKNPEDTQKPETVANVLLNALAAYPVTDRKEVFYVNKIAQQILEAVEKDGATEFSDVYKSFLKEVVYRSMFRTELEDGNKVEKGVYLPFVVAQVLEELGITE